MDNNWQYDYSNGYAQPQYTQPSPDPSMGGPEPSDQQPKKKRPGTKKTLAAVALVLVCALAGVGGGVLGAALMRSTSGPVDIRPCRATAAPAPAQPLPAAMR